MTHTGITAINPTLYANPGYDPRRDFTPVGLIATIPIVLMTNTAFPVRTVAEKERAGLRQFRARRYDGAQAARRIGARRQGAEWVHGAWRRVAAQTAVRSRASTGARPSRPPEAGRSGARALSELSFIRLPIQSQGVALGSS
jgi:hypothetical protein